MNKLILSYITIVFSVFISYAQENYKSFYTNGKIKEEGKMERIPRKWAIIYLKKI
jgi:hypothetical protein